MSLKLLDYGDRNDRAELSERIDRLREQVGGSGEVAERVASIVDDVRKSGDAGVVRAMQRWTDPAFEADRIRVQPEELAAAERSLDAEMRGALERAIEHIRNYQRHILPADPPTLEQDGAELGLRFTPIPRVGLHVPGGKAAYPSTAMMLAVPAQEAGVEDLAVVTPPPTGGGADVAPLTLAVCSLLGIDRVYRLGGAQAIAALATGTESVAPVDFIAGPGNAYTQEAKRQVFGKVGIDGLFGPSEIVVVADETSEPSWVAADLLAQAEHDPGCCFLIGASREVIERTLAEVERQLPQRARREAIEPALSEWSAAVVAPDENTVVELVDTLAAEHVSLAVAEPERWLQRLRHGGAWFLGLHSPVASGDYYAGPSHCLPTGTTARFSSGLSVYTFLKRSSVEQYRQPLGDQAAEDIARIAEAEGLEGHAASVRVRRERK